VRSWCGSSPFESADRDQNRLSRDLNAVDQDMAPRLTFFTTEILWTFGIIFAVALVLPEFIFASVLLGAIFIFVADLYLASSRELQRHESVSRSPIYSLIGECTAGVATLRAYADAPRFFKVRATHAAGSNDEQTVALAQDANTAPFWTMWLTNRWLGIATDLLGAAAVLLASVAIVAVDLEASLAGFVLSCATPSDHVRHSREQTPRS